MAKVAVLGHGVVGSGVVELLHKNYESITKRAGQSIEVKHVLDLRTFENLPYSEKFTKDFNTILNDKEVKVVIEVMGGITFAYDYTVKCLKNGKSVVTSNKELVAEKGAELLKIAKEHNVNYFFEASVGGGIPIIRPLHMCLAANEIEEIAGILNGTTNFILAKMIQDQMSFEDALKLAQNKGYAEKDPTADIEGGDACRKICILASLAYGHHVYPQDVHMTGITKLTLEDVAYAENANRVIKLIGRAKKLEGDEIFAMLSPAMIPKSSFLAGIHGVYNGILIRGNATGQVGFFGKGAGKFPTASAVVADVIDIVKSPSTSISLSWTDNGEKTVVDYKQSSVQMYFRIKAQDMQKATAFIQSHLGAVQYLSRDNQPANELAFITKVIQEKKAREIIAQFADIQIEMLNKIRVLEY